MTGIDGEIHRVHGSEKSNSENEDTIQSNLYIQYNPYQVPMAFFHRTRTNNLRTCMEKQKNLE